MNLKQIAKDNLILKIMTGSHMYGTNTEESDKDYIGVYVPPKDFVLGTYKCEAYEEKTNPSNSGRRNTKDDIDYTVYPLQQYIKLVANGNPNIIETLFAPAECAVFCNDLGRELLGSANLFVSKRIKFRFLGYASSERNRLIKKYTEMNFDYDGDSAGNIIRLLWFGYELLATGMLALPTFYKSIILSIKKREWPLRDVIGHANWIEKNLEEAYQKSVLPETPNYEAINKLQISLIERHWKG